MASNTAEGGGGIVENPGPAAAAEATDSPGKLLTTGGGGQAASVPRKMSATRPPGGGLTTRTVLVAVDPSENSKSAFNWYLANIWRPDDLVVIVYCPEPPHIPSFSLKSGLKMPAEKWAEIMMDLNVRTQKLHEDYETTCISKKLHYKVRGEAFKNPGEGICHIAEEEKAGLIVLGSRGMGAVKRMLIGSVSEYVVRNTSIPSIIVPPPRGPHVV